MGFNLEARKALDDQLTTQHRFGGLRSAVQRFSPNGFNNTLANLQQAVGVTDPKNWTPEQIAQAAELLTNSRARYIEHRARWDEDRRRNKRLGERDPSTEELTAFGARSWFDEVSYSQRRKYRWVGLADWIRANDIAPTSFGPDMEDDFQEVLKLIPPARVGSRQSILAHYGPFNSTMEPANVIEIPDRIYNDPIPDTDYRSLSDRQRLLADCWYTRSADGYVRQRHVRRIITSEHHWVVPYVLAALGDYVIEVVQEVEIGLNRHAKPGSWHHSAYRLFTANNYDFTNLMRQRATSYWNCYYSAHYSRTDSSNTRPLYPALAVLDLLTEAHAYPRHYRLPRA